MKYKNGILSRIIYDYLFYMIYCFHIIYCDTKKNDNIERELFEFVVKVKACVRTVWCKYGVTTARYQLVTGATVH